MNIVLTIAYDGTHFSGWQVQPTVRTIQGTIEEAVFKITQEKVRVIGAGRTDAHVHAKGQVAHMHIKRIIEPAILKKALNAVLPHSIRILNLQPIDKNFHAQYSCVGKEYQYNICTNDVVLPFIQPYVWHYRKPIHMNLLKEAASQFIGEHDFRGFSNALGKGLVKENTIRTIYSIHTESTETGFRLIFIGNGFLYKMVRNITGMILSVASATTDFNHIARIFACKDRNTAEDGAPPQGLFLMQCFYKNHLPLNTSEFYGLYTYPAPQDRNY